MNKCVQLIIAGTLVGAGSAVASLDDGLVARYAFDGNTLDTSGNSNNATAYGGVTFVQGVLGSAVHFDGSGYVRANSSGVGNLGADATLAFWLKPDQIDGARVFEKDDKAYWWFILTTQGVWVRVHGTNSYQGPAWDLYAGTPAELQGKWNAVALRKVGAHFDLFLNGALASAVDTTISTIATTAPLNFGNSYFWNTAYYTGSVDETRVYSRALSNSEIAQLAAVPEPGTYLLLFLGLLVVRASARRNY